MAGMDGLALLREIKQRRPALPVLLVTAYGDDEGRRTAAELGAAAFLAKPVDFFQLKHHLAELSRTHRMYDQHSRIRLDDGVPQFVAVPSSSCAQCGG